METLGVDLRTRAKRLGAKEKARRKKCKVRFTIIKKNKAFQKNYTKVCVKNLLRAGMMPAKTWGAHAVGMSPTVRLKSRRQMAAAAGKKSTTSLSLFMEAYGIEVEEQLSTVATQYWAEGVWTGKWSHELKEAWMRQIREVQTWKQVRRRAGAVMCETRDLGIKRPYWHTLMFGNDIKIDMRFVCPKVVKKMLVHTDRSVYCKKLVAKHEYQELKEEAWLEPGLALFRKKVRENWTEKHHNVARKIFLDGGWTQKRLFDIFWSDTRQCQACKKDEGTEMHRPCHCPE